MIAILGTFIASSSAGMVYGFSAILLPQLDKPDSPIRVSPEIGSWVASAVPLFMSASSLISAPLLEYLGRRGTLIFVCVPICLGWILIVFASNLTMLFLARAIGGIGNGMIGTSFSLYLGEVTEPKYRGFFITLIMVASAIGIIIVHLFGSVLMWRYTAAIASSLPILAAVVMFCAPESPYWYIAKRRRAEAEAAMKWLRGDSPAVKQELEKAWTQQEQVN